MNRRGIGLIAPFPYFGGKSRVAGRIWERFGEVANYVEPFCGSAAVLLANPRPCIETINDASGHVANFWRATKMKADEVAEHADRIVSEACLIAINRRLIAAELAPKLKEDPEFFDAKLAGWWLWGMCCWIGDGFAVQDFAKLPHVGNAGRGINRKLPHVGDAGRGEYIRSLLAGLRDRLRDVRVCCGDWSRVTGPSVTTKHGLTAVFLDPPYKAKNRSAVYDHEREGCEGVYDWAAESGEDPRLRICLCGYDGDWNPPSGWELVRWKAEGGYGSQGDGRGRKNSRRERLWFSPHCLRPDLFSGVNE